MGDRRQAYRARQDHAALPGDDPVGRPHRAAAVCRGLGRSKARPEERHAARPATRSYRHGGEQPRPRAVLDTPDRLVEGAVMAKYWRLVAIWTGLLTHKSHLVNIARVVEVTPWVSGDWRIRLQDGAEVNLSRRYRQRVEALALVRS